MFKISHEILNIDMHEIEIRVLATEEGKKLQELLSVGLVKAVPDMVGKINEKGEVTECEVLSVSCVKKD